MSITRQFKQESGVRDDRGCTLAGELVGADTDVIDGAYLTQTTQRRVLRIAR